MAAAGRVADGQALPATAITADQAKADEQLGVGLGARRASGAACRGGDGIPLHRRDHIRDLVRRRGPAVDADDGGMTGRFRELADAGADEREAIADRRDGRDRVEDGDPGTWLEAQGDTEGPRRHARYLGDLVGPAARRATRPERSLAVTVLLPPLQPDHRHHQEDDHHHRAEHQRDPPVRPAGGGRRDGGVYQVHGCTSGRGGFCPCPCSLDRRTAVVKGRSAGTQARGDVVLDGEERLRLRRWPTRMSGGRGGRIASS